MTLTLLHSKLFDVGDLPVLTFGNRVLKTGVIKWPLKLRAFFSFFFKIQKAWPFTCFWVAAHVFSNAGWACSRGRILRPVCFWEYICNPFTDDGNIFANNRGYLTASVHSFATSVVHLYSPDVTSRCVYIRKVPKQGNSCCDVFRNGQWHYILALFTIHYSLGNGK